MSKNTRGPLISTVLFFSFFDVNTSLLFYNIMKGSWVGEATHRFYDDLKFDVTLIAPTQPHPPRTAIPLSSCVDGGLAGRGGAVEWVRLININ